MGPTNPHQPTTTPEPTTQDTISIHSTSSESSETPETTFGNTLLIRAFSNPARLPAASPFSHPFPQGHRTSPRNTNHPTQTRDNGRNELVGTSAPPYSVNRPPGDLKYVWLSNSEGVNFAPGGSNYRPVMTRSVQSPRRPVSAPPHLPPVYTAGEGAPYLVAAGEVEVEDDVDSQVLLTRCRDRVRQLGWRLVVKVKTLTKWKFEDGA